LSGKPPCTRTGAAGRPNQAAAPVVSLALEGTSYIDGPMLVLTAATAFRRQGL